MTARVLVIGGYGNFGGRIAASLAADDAVRVLVGGRSQAAAEAFAGTLAGPHRPEAHGIDIDTELPAALARIAPDIVVHASGPYQRQPHHHVARACIGQGCHYIDIADARAFVTGIAVLDEAARARGVLAVSGASSVPCLTAAVIDHHLPGFARLDTIACGISAAQQTNRGLATTTAVLGYVGRPFTRLRDGAMRTVHGWQGTHAVRYPELGLRLFGDCDVPDLDLFPTRYPGVRDIRFAAGHEIALLHLGTWALGWLVRLRLLGGLDRHGALLLRLARLFDRLGTSRSGFHVFLAGLGHDGQPRTVRFFMLARSGHGPQIPCTPAILLARRLARGAEPRRGAMPCLDLIALDDYLTALAPFDISVQVVPGDA
jgi:hypothetical protein